MTLREQILKNSNVLNETVESDFEIDSKKCFNLIYKTLLKYKTSIESHKGDMNFIIEEFRSLKEDVAGYCDDIIDVYEDKV